MNPRRRLMLKTRAKKNAEAVETPKVVEPVVVEIPKVSAPKVSAPKVEETPKPRKRRASTRKRKTSEE